VLETRASQSRPEMGSIRSEMKTFNQHDEPVLRFVSIGLIGTRPA
jgi:acyl dehydratase